MARPRTFDADHALASAMHTFWRNGYEATSIQDLVEATGVNRHSLYALWGDKHGLLLASLDHYGCSVGAFWLRLLDEDEPLPGIRRLFHTLADAILADPDRMGCFALNTALELGARDPEAHNSVRSRLDEMQAGLHRTLARASAAGQLPADFDVDQHAGHLAISIQALLLQARCGAPEATVRAFVDVALSTLPEVAP